MRSNNALQTDVPKNVTPFAKRQSRAAFGTPLSAPLSREKRSRPNYSSRCDTCHQQTDLETIHRHIPPANLRRSPRVVPTEASTALLPVAVGRIDEWYLDFDNSFCHFNLRLGDTLRAGKGKKKYTRRATVSSVRSRSGSRWATAW